MNCPAPFFIPHYTAEVLRFFNSLLTVRAHRFFNSPFFQRREGLPSFSGQAKTQQSFHCHGKNFMFLQIHYTIFGAQSIHKKCEMLLVSLKKLEIPIDKHLKLKLCSQMLSKKALVQHCTGAFFAISTGIGDTS